jgi:stress-induced morphogen
MTSVRLVKLFSLQTTLKSIRQKTPLILSSAFQQQTSKRDLTSLTTIQNDASSSSANSRTEGELLLTNLLKERFPNAKTIQVNDISGGCGNMYAIYVESIEFKDMRKVQQHKLINETLKTQIKNNMHGLRILTAVPTQ